MKNRIIVLLCVGTIVYDCYSWYQFGLKVGLSRGAELGRMASRETIKKLKEENERLEDLIEQRLWCNTVKLE